MRLDINLEFHRRGRVWIDTLPGGVLTLDVQTISLPCASRAADPCTLAVEIEIPRGPMISYGLLGLHYRPGGSVLEVSVSVSTGGIWSDSLAAGDTVHWGLEEEYADAVLESASRVAEAGTLPCGSVAFDYSAFGEVGSSPRVFGALAAVLLQVTSASPRPREVDEWRHLLNSVQW